MVIHCKHENKIGKGNDYKHIKYTDKNVINLIKKSKDRKAQGLFVVEGKRMFEETPKERIHSLLSQRALKGRTRTACVDMPMSLWQMTYFRICLIQRHRRGSWHL